MDCEEEAAFLESLRGEIAHIAQVVIGSYYSPAFHARYSREDFIQEGFLAATYALRHAQEQKKGPSEFVVG